MKRTDGHGRPPVSRHDRGHSMTQADRGRSLADADRERRRLLRAGPAWASIAGIGFPGPVGAATRSTGAEETRVVESEETPLGRLTVFDIGRIRYLAYGPIEGLVFQSAMDLDRPDHLVAPYTRLMMLGIVYTSPGARIVQVGVGAGNMARYAIRTFPSVVVDAIDVDSRAVEFGMRHFGLVADPRLHLHVADGRRWLEATDAMFDVVMLDAYDDRSIPAALLDRDFFRIVADRLAPGGVVMQNVFTPQVDQRALTAAIAASFEQVDAYRIRQSLVLAAYRGARRAPGELRDRARRIDATLRPLHSLEQLLELRAARP
jgi:spermidine synthase